MTSLLAIVAHARAGAIDNAWRMFVDAGYAGVDDDAAVLCVRGRLLKDQAGAANGAERRARYLAAADAYARAAAIDGATYPLINAATLALLAGDAARAAALAGDVLARLDAGPPDAETPYWRGATRAEALLLTGHAAAARTALAEAVALAPMAWEDHAATLRQFALILGALGSDTAWLDDFRPPRALHFAGHMAVGVDAGALTDAVADVLARERIGAGYGALAAGADIVIAEALLAAGADLHVVLPAAAERFAAASVDPLGADWRRRFDAALAAAATVRITGQPHEPLDATAIAFASECAMGAAILAAGMLATEAVQLVVAAPDGGSGDAQTWAANGRRQHCLAWPRAAEAGVAAVVDMPRRTVRAMLRVRVDGAEADTLGAALARQIADAGGGVRGAWRDDGLAADCHSVAAAAALAAALHAAAPGRLSIGGDYGLVSLASDPFGSGDIALGPPGRRAARIAALAPPGATYVGATFVEGLSAGTPAQWRSEIVGDDPESSDRLYALFGRT